MIWQRYGSQSIVASLPKRRARSVQRRKEAAIVARQLHNHRKLSDRLGSTFLREISAFVHELLAWHLYRHW